MVSTRILTAIFVIFGLAAEANAHPHVWVTVNTTIVFDANGAATALRHVWHFDDMYSTFAVEGIPQKTKGVIANEDLKGLAEANITSLKGSDFFTFAKASQKDLAFADATDYWLEYKAGALALHFTLPFKQPVTAKELSIEVYDPTYFVDLTFSKKNAAVLLAAPAQCKVTTRKNDNPLDTQKLDETSLFMGSPGAGFASKMFVKCP
jgi:ABC-type uncharacterized transport system substrate-binding protein